MNRKYTLTSESAKSFLQNSLQEDLALEFSKLVFNEFPWPLSRFQVFGKEKITDAELLDFQFGGKVIGSPTTGDLLVTEFLQPQLSENRFLIIEDWRAKPESSFLKEMKLPAFFFERQTYYLVSSSDPRITPNWPRICSNSSPLFHGFLIDSADRPLIGEVVTKDRMIELAAKVQLIFIGVYDGESYLVASR